MRRDPNGMGKLAALRELRTARRTNGPARRTVNWGVTAGAEALAALGVGAAASAQNNSLLGATALTLAGLSSASTYNSSKHLDDFQMLRRISTRRGLPVASDHTR